jgi:hypothetical protein
MTNEEHILLNHVGDLFWTKFGELVADHVAMLPGSLETEALMYLQEKASVFGSCYRDFLADKRKYWRSQYDKGENQ